MDLWDTVPSFFILRSLQHTCHRSVMVSKLLSMSNCTLMSRCSILACSAFVALALGDNVMALTHAEKLLQQPKVSGSHK